ncbi:jerky protein homolog-like [Condylostylus longicornis]|nr:jerky protein homolog-like [Condylostylus longicornis]
MLLEKMEKEELTKDQLYNVDETGLFYKNLPEKTYVLSSEKNAPGIKSYKQRITVLLGTNATGSHKLKPLIIGKAANPRCFKNFQLPLEYNHSKNAWMTTDIFKKWFHHSFVPQVKKFLASKNIAQKAILLLDNAPSHPPAEQLISEDGKIFVLYMPPNVTPLIQPMDQNVIRITKLNYRACLLSSILSTTNNSDIITAIKNINLKEVVINLTAAWNKIDKEMILKCWKNILKEDEFDDEDEIPLSILMRDDLDINVRTKELALLLNTADTNEYSLEDIQRWNRDEITDNENYSVSSEDTNLTENVIETVEAKISDYEALEALNKTIQWAADNDIFEQVQ